MTLLILQDGVWFSVINNVPGNLEPSQILPMWLDYLGIDKTTHQRYTAQWINGTDYNVMRRWRTFNGDKPAVDKS